MLTICGPGLFFHYEVSFESLEGVLHPYQYSQTYAALDEIYSGYVDEARDYNLRHQWRIEDSCHQQYFVYWH